MDDGRCQKSLNGASDIWLYQNALFVRVNLTTRTAANEIAVFAHVTPWCASIYMYKYQMSCLFMKDVIMVQWYVPFKDFCLKALSAFHIILHFNAKELFH